MATGTREAAVDRARATLEDGTFLGLMTQRVARRTESQLAGRGDELHAYLDQDMRAQLERLGCEIVIVENSVDGYGPFMIARRIEDPSLPTILMYGHGDVVRGMEGRWAQDRDPWRLEQEGDRLYGRGTADNKGQHTINLLALEAVLTERGRLSFNLTALIETGEETGSPGLRRLCETQGDMLRADLLVASDGPRLQRGLPTIYGGNRGGSSIRLVVDLRKGAHHSGNWGGLLANPAIILSHALATITDAHGRILIEGWKPTPLDASSREAVRALPAGGEEAGEPAIDEGWGEPGLAPVERLVGWNSFEILAMHAGTPEAPQNAIPGRADAVGQLRFVVGTDAAQIIPALRAHLDAHGFGMVEIEKARDHVFGASRTPVDHPAMQLAARSVERTVGKAPALLPNTGGSLPGDLFQELLGLPMVWVPHSYSSCSQHAPDEHLLLPVVRESLEIMAGLYWDLGESAREISRA